MNRRIQVLVLCLFLFPLLSATGLALSSSDTFLSSEITEHSGVSEKNVLTPQEKESQEEVQKEETPAADSKSLGKQVKIIAYYFHGNHRCYTCRTIEQYSREAIEEYFAKELKEGLLEFKPVNIDEPENRHFIQDFQLYTRSLVLTIYDGKELKKYKNLDEVWTHVKRKLKFYLYVKNEVEQFLKEAA